MSSSQDASQMEKQTRPYPTLPGPFSNTSVGLNAPPQEVVAAKNGVKYRILGLHRLIVAFPHGSPVWPEY